MSSGPNLSKINTGSPRILAIESSCDETAAAVVVGNGFVLSNVIASQIPIHARYGGVVPELASRNHLTALRPVIEEALSEAGLSYDDLDAIAVTSKPGLAGCLLVGLQTAKALAYTRTLPLVSIDHVEAHVHAVFLSDDEYQPAERPQFPYIALAVSGGHTSLTRVDGPGQSTILGQTLDDAAGEAFDKAAKMMGLPYPGGVVIDRLSREGRADAFDFPRPMLGRGLDFSFSGLKTAIRYTLRDIREAEGEDAELPLADLAASLQEAIVDCLVKKSLKACRQTQISQLVVAGGVACNSRLRDKLTRACVGAQLTPFLVPPRYCTDNAAMIGGLACSLYERGDVLTGDDLLSLDIQTTKRPKR